MLLPCSIDYTQQERIPLTENGGHKLFNRFVNNYLFAVLIIWKNRKKSFLLF